MAIFSTDARAAIERGLASTYTDTEVACPGERFDAKALAAAHRTLPCGTRVKVTNLDNGKSVVVRINDKGPCGTPECQRDHPRFMIRIIDLTPAAADRIDSAGMVKVELEEVQGFEDRWQMVQDVFPKKEGHPDTAKAKKTSRTPHKQAGARVSSTKAYPKHSRDERGRKEDRKKRPPKSATRG